MRLAVVWLLTLTGSTDAGDVMRRAIFDCSRIDTAFCCTSRVRSVCAEQCKEVPCTGQGEPEPRDGVSIRKSKYGSDAEQPRYNIETATTPPAVPPILLPQQPPPQTVPSLPPFPQDGTAHRFQQNPPPPWAFTTATSTEAPRTGHPTLIPFEPSIDDIDESQVKSDVTEAPPVIYSTIVKSIHHRVRTTPDPRIIKPPESLVVIGDYDEEELDRRAAVEVGGGSIEPTTTDISVDTDFAVVFTRTTTKPLGVEMPRRFISEEATVEPPRLNRAESAQWNPTPLPGWIVGVLPMQKIPSWPESVDNIPNFAVDGSSSKTTEAGKRKDSGGFGLIRTINIGPAKVNKVAGNDGSVEPQVLKVPNNLRTTQTPFQISVKSLRPMKSGSVVPGWGHEVQQRFHVGSATSAPAPSPAPAPAPSTLPNRASFLMRPMVPNQPAPGPPQQALTVQEQCGVAPNFNPCVSSQEASHALLECCRRKNLPHGCLSLCRYDITQAEVRSAMDRGLCGLLSVAPYLECASQGKDNTECCRYKGVTTKTGPQCEQFCRPTQGLSSLGLQHIVCGNAIGDMLQCHHAGIRL